MISSRFRSAPTAALSAGILVLLASFAGPATAQESPEEVAIAIAEAGRSMDTERIAELMHPAEIDRFRSAFSAGLGSPELEPFLVEVLQVESPADARSLTDREFFARIVGGFLEAAGGADGALMDVIRGSEAAVVGSVVEGADTMHVVLRVRMEVEGIPISDVEVQSLARSDEGWRGLLGAELHTIAAVMQQGVNEQVDGRIK